MNEAERQKFETLAKKVIYETLTSDRMAWEVLADEFEKLAARASESSPPQPELVYLRWSGDDKLQICDLDSVGAFKVGRAGAAATAPSAPKAPRMMSNPSREIVAHSGTHVWHGDCAMWKCVEAPVEAAPSAPTATPEPKVADALESEAVDWLRENGFPPGQPMHFQIGERGAEGERFGYKYPCEVLAAFVRSRGVAPTATDWMRQAAMELFPDNQHAFDAIGHGDDKGLQILYNQVWDRYVEIMMKCQAKYAGEPAGAAIPQTLCKEHWNRNCVTCETTGAAVSPAPTTRAPNICGTYCDKCLTLTDEPFCPKCGNDRRED